MARRYRPNCIWRNGLPGARIFLVKKKEPGYASSVATEDVQTRLPENFVRAARIDAERLLKLTPEQRAALVAALQRFTPSTGGIDQEEAEALGQSVGVDAETVESAIRLSYVLRPDTRVGALAGAEVAAALRQALSEVKLTGADSLLQEMGSVAATVAKSFSRVARLERTMPTLIESVVACDLRYLPSEQPDDFDLVPMAIVRLELDGVDDAIFHCTPQTLRRLLKTLETAVTTLDTLSKAADRIKS